jgi:Na+/melibiose symporter-like transporter
MRRHMHRRAAADSPGNRPDMTTQQARPAYGLLVLALAAIAGTALSIFNYYVDIGINHTDGVLVVIATTVVMWIAALVMVQARSMWSWARAIILLLLLIDILGTGIAGWFLESWVLMAFMAVALFGWAAHVAFGPGRVSRPPRRPAAVSGVA